jgi:hypothetical protein
VEYIGEFKIACAHPPTPLVFGPRQATPRQQATAALVDMVDKLWAEFKIDEDERLDLLDAIGLLLQRKR